MTFPSGRIREVKPFSFIYEVAQALPGDVCLEAIRRFEASTDQQYRGRIGQAGEEAPEVKRSTDLRISGREDWHDIDRTLSQQLVASVQRVRARVSVLCRQLLQGHRLQPAAHAARRVLPLARGRRPGRVQRASVGRDLVPQ